MRGDEIQSPRRRAVWGRHRDISSSITGGKTMGMAIEIGRLVDLVVDSSLVFVK